MSCASECTHTWLDLKAEQKLRDAAIREQPRPAIDKSTRCCLPRAPPVDQEQSPFFRILNQDCRNLIWEHVLRPPQTRIERWHVPDEPPLYQPEPHYFDAECFPYRMMAAKWERCDKPLSVLLGCRRMYLEGLPILYSTTFIFEEPLDLCNFQLCASPEGLSTVKRLIIAYGDVSWPRSGPFLTDPIEQRFGSLREWEKALDSLRDMDSVHEVQVWLAQSSNQSQKLERRPWKADEGNEEVEKRHRRLFELFDSVDVQDFTIHLTWNAEDICLQQGRRLRIELHTMNEMSAWDEALPQRTWPDPYAW